MTQTSLSVTCIGSNIRSNLYKLLSSGFRYPTPEAFKTFQNGEFLVKLWGSISLLPHLKPIITEMFEVSRRTLRDLEGLTFADFEAKLAQTFDIGVPELFCMPYEGLYRKESGADITLDISEFYRNFGLVISKHGGKHELPDHLSAELEFLSFLTFKESQVRKSKDYRLVKDYIMAQKDFLERHLIQWVPKFCDLLQKAPILPFYLVIVRVTALYITCELQLVTSSLEDIEANRIEEHEPVSL